MFGWQHTAMLLSAGCALAMDLLNIMKHVACASDCVQQNFSRFLSTALAQQDGLRTALLALCRAVGSGLQQSH
jgi:hypothetical protein